METLETLRRQIEVAQDLRSIVRTLKTLAMINIRHYDNAVASLADYYRTVEMGLHILFRSEAKELLLRRSTKGGTLGAIVFGSDQGLCGGFNERIVDTAMETFEALDFDHPNRLVIAVGERAKAQLEAAGQPVEKSFFVPASLTGITPLIQEILRLLDVWQTIQGVTRVRLFFNRPAGGITYQSISLQLLPPDWEHFENLAKKAWHSRSLPIYHLDPDRLLSSLVRQYLFVSLYRAFAESAASENASRLAALQAAERNIEESLSDLNLHYNHQRQESITEELLDVVAGAEVLSSTPM